MLPGGEDFRCAASSGAFVYCYIIIIRTKYRASTVGVALGHSVSAPQRPRSVSRQRPRSVSVSAPAASQRLLRTIAGRHTGLRKALNGTTSAVFGQIAEDGKKSPSYRGIECHAAINEVVQIAEN